MGGGEQGFSEKPLDTDHATKNLNELIGDFGAQWRNNNYSAGDKGYGPYGQPNNGQAQSGSSSSSSTNEWGFKKDQQIGFGDLFGSHAPVNPNKNLGYIY